LAVVECQCHQQLLKEHFPHFDKLKTILRTTMTQEHLNNVMLLVYMLTINELTRLLNIQEIAAKFAGHHQSKYLEC